LQQICAIGGKKVIFRLNVDEKPVEPADESVNFGFARWRTNAVVQKTEVAALGGLFDMLQVHITITACVSRLRFDPLRPAAFEFVWCNVLGFWRQWAKTEQKSI